MKKLFDILGHRASRFNSHKFKDAEPNPFFDDEDDEGNDKMAKYVRKMERRRGLDRTSRSHTSPESGVFSSRYDDMVRDIDDLERYDDDDYRSPATRNRHDDYEPDFDDKEDKLYLYTKDRSYEKNEFNDEDDVDDFDADAGWEFMRKLNAQNNFQDDFENDEDNLDDDEEDIENNLDDEDDLNDKENNNEELDNEELDNEEKSKYDGIVRSVKGAYLVSKKQQPDETYKEVWIYNVGKKFSDEANIRKSILAYTDIDPTKNFSEDGSQEAVITTVGNVQYLTIVGLPD